MPPERNRLMERNKRRCVPSGRFGDGLPSDCGVVGGPGAAAVDIIRRCLGRNLRPGSTSGDVESGVSVNAPGREEQGEAEEL